MFLYDRKSLSSRMVVSSITSKRSDNFRNLNNRIYKVDVSVIAHKHITFDCIKGQASKYLLCALIRSKKEERLSSE